MESEQELDTNWLASIFQRNYRDDKPLKLIEAKVNSGAQTGDNYGSVVSCVKMKFICGSGKIKKRSVIVKTERGWNDTSVISSALFRNEIMVYSTIFSMMEDLMEEFDDKRDKLWPNLYGFQPYNLIAVEDLKETQFKTADRKKSLDLNHASLVLRSMGRFHALSKVLMGRGLLTNADLGPYPSAEANGFLDKMWTALLTVFSDGIRDEWGDEWYDLSESMRNKIDTALSGLREKADNYDPRFEVMTHGDMWLCNMMFRYMEYENVPISVKFIDLQTTFRSSFIWDVSYFMITSIIPSIRRENTFKLLETYCDSLAENLKFFGYTGYVPTQKDVESEWKRVQSTHLLFLGVHIIMSTEASRVLNLEKVMSDSPHEVYNVEAFTNGKAQKAIGEDLKRLHEDGIF